MAVLASGQACYSYHTAQLPNIQPGEEIRLSLEEEGFRRVVPGAGQNAAPRVEGRLAGVTNDSVTVRVWIGEAYQGTPFYSTYQNLTLSLEQVRSVEHRTLSRRRTALVAGGALVLIGVLIESIGFTDLFGDGGGGTIPQPPDPTGIGGTVSR
jgi:hypothetical protein